MGAREDDGGPEVLEAAMNIEELAIKAGDMADQFLLEDYRGANSKQHITAAQKIVTFCSLSQKVAEERLTVKAALEGQNFFLHLAEVHLKIAEAKANCNV